MLQWLAYLIKSTWTPSALNAPRLCPPSLERFQADHRAALVHMIAPLSLLSA